MKGETMFCQTWGAVLGILALSLIGCDQEYVCVADNSDTKSCMTAQTNPKPADLASTDLATKILRTYAFTTKSCMTGMIDVVTPLTDTFGSQIGSSFHCANGLNCICDIIANLGYNTSPADDAVLNLNFVLAYKLEMGGPTFGICLSKGASECRLFKKVSDNELKSNSYLYKYNLVDPKVTDTLTLQIIFNQNTDVSIKYPELAGN